MEWENIKIIPNGNLETNTYIIWKRNSCIVIDPGEDSEEIMYQLSKLSKNVEAILLTHGHYDHIASANEISSYYNCPILADENEFEILQDCEKNFSKIRLDLCIEIDEILLPMKEEFTIADMEVKIVKTPGHTKGGVCIWLKEYDYLFTGDTVHYYDVGRCDLYSGDVKEMYKSLEKIAKLPGNLYVFPGHGPGEKLATLTNVNEYLRKFR